MFTPEKIFDLLVLGWLSTVALAIGSIASLAIFVARYLKMRGLERESRDISSQVIEALVRRDVVEARRLCDESDTPKAELYLEGLRWQNVALEDLERIFATIRAELSEHNRGLAKGMQLLDTEGAEEDVVQAMLYLAGPKARFVTGETLRVTGGMAPSV